MPAEKKTTAKKTSAKKTAAKKIVAKKTAKKKQPEALEPEVIEAGAELAPALTVLQAQADPIGDETDGEAATSTGEAEVEAGPAAEAEPEVEAEPETGADAEGEDGPDADEEDAAPRPPAKLERLQKIMAQAGVASRRAAEKLIEEGRVQVNGKIVTELGTKADGGRDHIRVDGKLLHGAERLRYFVLNKPKGFVTTVKDPEGRPTVMQFFDKMRERLYPVGRLDYLSEGLLLVTNDGELANRLTKAASGVEKTYLVKVAGVPTEDELDRLRAGLTIDKGAPGEGRVRTSPARIRQVRHGDNPWYEVVLVEGRNRELRKMFEEIGHFVEKIRRVGYGPLVLDQEPGKLRELDEHELTLLRKAADGTLRTAKSRAGSQVKYEDSLPPEKPAFRGKVGKPGAWKRDGGKKAFGGDKPLRRPTEPGAFGIGASEGRPFAAKPFEKTGEGRTFAKKPFDKFDKRNPFGSGAPERRPFGGAKPAFGRSADRSAAGAGARPAWKRDGQESGGRGPQRFGGGARIERPGNAGSTGAAPGGEAQRPTGAFGARPAEGRTFGKKPAFGRPFAGKPADRGFGETPRTGGFGDRAQGRGFGDKPAWKKPGDRPTGDFGSKPAWKKPGDRPGGDFERKAAGSDRPPFKRAFTPRPPAVREADEPMNFEPRKPSRLRIEAIEGPDRREDRRPEGFRPQGARPGGAGPRRTGTGGSGAGRGAERREFKPRPFTPRTESGRGGGGRASGGGSGSGRTGFGRESGGRSDSPRPFRGEGGLPRPFTTSSGQPRTGGPRPSSRPGKPAGAGWKPKPGGKPGFKSGPRSGSGSGGGFKSGFKGKPGGKRPSGKRG
jgi:23S rRNA pseudouridine2605 synthase